MNAITAKTRKNHNLPDWDYLVKETARAFSLSCVEEKRLRQSATARIIATIPFAAGCNDAQRTAIAHLCLYVVERKAFEKDCAHTPCDDADPRARLQQISSFNGGDPVIINHGMDILTLIMLEGYHASAKHDKACGVYNPLNSGAWNYEQMKSDLQNKIAFVDCPPLDTLGTALTW